MPEISTSRLRAVSSRQNAQVKQLRHAFARGEAIDGLCAVEGTRLIEEAIRSSLKVQALFVRNSSQAKAERVLQQLGKNIESLLLPDDVFDSAVLTEHPQGLAALVKIREHDLDGALAHKPELLMIAAAIQDPGNLGTIVRSAEAFGATAVIATEGSVELWNPKTVRASAGSMFRLAAVKTPFRELLERLREREVQPIALVAPREPSPDVQNSSGPRSAISIQECDLAKACALFVGNEGAGVPREVLRQVPTHAFIPQAHVESLNAGIAASIALYEASRQRSGAVR
ncbi:MAG TPA: RNA methyltransferase [Terriglobales bacterium]|nr:RNA methyltransferase [Terriglobales bacterium]